jgi:hypothetical protein
MGWEGMEGGLDMAKCYEFDNILDESLSNREVYDSCIGQFVEEFISGYNLSIMCYGITGAGKTYTMFGSD